MGTPSQPAGRPRLRAIARDAVRVEVIRQAMDLFLERGFEETTVDDICASAGISPRSFFRYFASKEEVVVGDAHEDGEAFVELIKRRPIDEDPWTSMGYGLLALFTFDEDASARRFFQIMTVICRSPNLRASYSEKHLVWVQLLLPVLLDRSSRGGAEARLRMRAFAHSALACLDAALVEWVEQSGAEPLHDLLASAFAVHGYRAVPRP